jgi:BirA family biotin operon repressor/biotin-[acetyl-CoA-carboxylase] ligase
MKSWGREIDRENRLKDLLNQARERELKTRQSSWGEAAEVILRRGALVGRCFYCYPILDRCITEAKRLIQAYEQLGEDFPSGGVIVARALRDARGRWNRFWHAPPGGAWLTLVIHPDVLKERLHLYSLAAGVACCETVRSFGVPASIKWVNDIHVNGKKIGGILTLGHASELFKQEYLLIGMGINVNNNHFPKKLIDNAESIFRHTGVMTDLDEFIATLLSKLNFYLGIIPHYEQQLLDDPFGSSKACNPIVDVFKELSDTIGRQVAYGIDVMKEPLLEAEVCDIDDDGGIVLLTKPDRHAQKRHSGEISYLVW